MNSARETILVLDFGGQYTQLIARRVRELGCYCEIVRHDIPIEEVINRDPCGLILSGGPSSVYEESAPVGDPRLLSGDWPVLGICYGLQWQAQALGGVVTRSNRREYGHALIHRLEPSPLFEGLPQDLQVWMSHGDVVRQAPPGFDATARSDSAICAMEHAKKRIYGVQFHPEVTHTPGGRAILENFLRRICHARGDWSMASFISSSISSIQSQIGEGRAVCALSGGVDSSVAASLVERAIGDRLQCLFVDNGLLRAGEFDRVMEIYDSQMHLNVNPIRAGNRFLGRLRGISDPEQKRRIIGEEFIHVFQEEAEKLGSVEFLVQGTLYPDVIESVPVKGPSAAIKSHHNVGGLPRSFHLTLVEPLRELFKDEVREVGRQLNVPFEILRRHPFPGPGLAVRCLGEVTAERLEILRSADRIFIDEIRAADLYDEIWQAFVVLLPVSSVGVMGDARTYESVAALRAVTSTDGMTADWAKIPSETLQRIAGRIIAEVRGINRVVYDISSKPPSTIEWE